MRELFVEEKNEPGRNGCFEHAWIVAFVEAENTFFLTCHTETIDNTVEFNNLSKQKFFFQIIIMKVESYNNQTINERLKNIIKKNA